MPNCLCFNQYCLQRNLLLFSINKVLHCTEDTYVATHHLGTHRGASKFVYALYSMALVMKSLQSKLKFVFVT